MTATTHDPAVDVGHYAYRVNWSAEDNEYVATTLEWGPGLSWLDEDPAKAIDGLREVIAESVRDLIEDGQDVPQPLADRDFSGRFNLRVPPQLHADLVFEAAEARISLNQHIVTLLSRDRVRPASASTVGSDVVRSLLDRFTLNCPQDRGDFNLGNLDPHSKLFLLAYAGGDLDTSRSH